MTRRRRISLHDEIKFASIVRCLCLNPGTGPSLKAVARARGFAPCQLRKWEWQLDSLIQQPNLATATLNLGRNIDLAPIKDGLLIWLSNMRQDGVPVFIKMLTVRASQMMPSFGEKEPHSKYMAVSHLLKSNGFSNLSKPRWLKHQVTLQDN